MSGVPPDKRFAATVRSGTRIVFGEPPRTARGDACAPQHLLRGAQRPSAHRHGARNHRAGNFPLCVAYAQYLDPHRRQAGAVESKLFGNRLRNVQCPSRDEGTTIIQTDDG